jgi:predicted nucleic-acid-binding Zn-ribbon protein
LTRSAVSAAILSQIGKPKWFEEYFELDPSSMKQFIGEYLRRAHEGRANYWVVKKNEQLWPKKTEEETFVTNNVDFVLRTSQISNQCVVQNYVHKSLRIEGKKKKKLFRLEKGKKLGRKDFFFCKSKELKGI